MIYSRAYYITLGWSTYIHAYVGILVKRISYYYYDGWYVAHVLCRRMYAYISGTYIGTTRF